MRYVVPEHVYANVVHEEVMLLDTRTDQYLGLNRTATVIWQSLLSDGSVDQATADLVAKFDVTPEMARSHVDTIVQQLLVKGLLEQAPA